MNNKYPPEHREGSETLEFNSMNNKNITWEEEIAEQLKSSTKIIEDAEEEILKLRKELEERDKEWIEKRKVMKGDYVYNSEGGKIGYVTFEPRIILEDITNNLNK